MMSQLEAVTLILVLYGAQIEVPDACGQWNEPFTHLRFDNDMSEPYCGVGSCAFAIEGCSQCFSRRGACVDCDFYSLSCMKTLSSRDLFQVPTGLWNQLAGLWCLDQRFTFVYPTIIPAARSITKNLTFKGLRQHLRETLI